MWSACHRWPVPRARGVRLLPFPCGIAMVSRPHWAQTPRSRSNTLRRRYWGSVFCRQASTHASEQNVRRHRPLGISWAHWRHRGRPVGPRGNLDGFTHPPGETRRVLTGTPGPFPRVPPALHRVPGGHKPHGPHIRNSSAGATGPKPPRGSGAASGSGAPPRSSRGLARGTGRRGPPLWISLWIRWNFWCGGSAGLRASGGPPCPSGSIGLAGGTCGRLAGARASGVDWSGSWFGDHATLL